MEDGFFGPRLMKGERMLWAGKPGQGLLLTPQDAVLIPFSVLWCGFAIFWTFVAHRQGVSNFFSAALLCAGLYLAVGRFFLDAWLRRDLRYAVTNRRILIARPAPFRRFTEVNLAQLPEVYLKVRPDGRGTIQFGSATVCGLQIRSSVEPSRDATPQFLVIDEARGVFDLIQRTARK